MAKYKFHGRRVVGQNSRFYICFDSIECSDGTILKDYLTIKPKVSQDNDVVGVCILPCIGNEFVLMKGWRHQFDSEVWQAPAGFVEEGETSIQSARRELLEETGLSCDISDIIPLGSYIPDAGLIQGKVALFLAQRCSRTNQSLDQEVGTGQLHLLSSSRLYDLIASSPDIGGSTCMVCLRSLRMLRLIQ